MSGKSFRYKFSLVMPIYNTEPYIREAVESVLAQTIDFEKNCEIIFINDGSTDNSEDVCLEYKNIFPNNIVYIKQTNQGVSASRNRGLDIASGKYISFLDSDDKLSVNTLSQVYDFFEKHQDEIDLCTIKIDFFGAKEGDHHLNDKFDKSKIVDIEKDYQYVVSAIGPCFIKSSVISTDHRFDTKLEVTEDGKFLTEIILNKMKYGAVYGPVYYYRKRVGEESAVSGRWNKSSWYEETPERCFEYLFKYSKSKLGYIPKYVQYFVMYHIKWALKKNELPFLDTKELSVYRKKLKNILRSIDKEVIVKQKDFPVDYKAYAISEKISKPIDSIVQYKNGRLLVDGTVVQNIKNLYVGIEFIKIKNRRIEIEGYTHGYNVSNFKFGFRVKGRVYESKNIKRPYMERYSLGNVSFEKIPFVISVPLKGNINKLQPTAIIDNEEFRIRSLRFKHFARLTEDLKFTYFVTNEKILQYRNGNIIVQNYTKTIHIKRELKYLRELIYKRRYEDVYIRLARAVGKIFYRKPVWIISDRLVSAGDNGEALFRYISRQKNKSENVFFAVNKTSPDFDRIKKYGKVIDRESNKYKILFLLSEKVISSHFDRFVFDAFGDMNKSQRNLYNFEYIFLRHGVSKDDMSKQISKYKINASLVMASSKLEYDDIVSNFDKYGYDKKAVKLTGLPRYDYLNNNPNNTLVLAPTWRKHLSMKPIEGTDVRPYDRDFKKTEYFKFYNSLITDKRILNVLKDSNMRCEFYLHPALIEQSIDFKDSEYIDIKTPPYSYKEAFSKGSILVTDYSSVAFDFAYLKKPVIYTQFDKDNFFKYQYTPGYFSYEDDGFGEVTYDYESAVHSIIDTIGKNNNMLNMYKKRVDKFFAYNDKNNSKRVYESIR